MKKLLTLTLAFGCAGAGFAQNRFQTLPASFNPKLQQQYQIVSQLINRLQPPTPAKTSGIQQRLIAQSDYDLSGTTPQLADSMRFVYSGTNGSGYNFDDMYFNYDYDPISGDPFYYGSDAYKPEIFCDSVIGYSDDGAGQIEVSSNIAFGYNSSKDINDYFSGQYSSNTLYNGLRYQNTYNGQGQLATTLALIYDGAQWDSSNRKYFTYNALGKLASDSLVAYDANTNTWTPNTREHLSYDNNGSLIGLDNETWDPASSTWTLSYHYDIDYTTGNKLKDVIVSIDLGTGTLSHLKDSLDYAGGTAFYTSRYLSLDTGNQQYLPLIRLLKHLNAQGLPDTVTQEEFDLNNNVWLLDATESLQYNSSGNPSQTLGIQDAGSSFRSYYYYEQYDDNPSAVAEVTAKNPNINVYPNPAGNVLNLDWKEAVPNTPVAISLTNPAGQSVYSEQLNWKGQSLQISTASLPQGLYVLSVTDRNGTRLHTQTILKQ